MIFNYLRLFVFRKKYRKMNMHNKTHAINIFDMQHISVGRETYGGIQINDWGKDDYKVCIGSYCSIGPNVLFLLGSEHNLDTLTTYPLKVKKIKCEKKEAFSKGNIVIKDDVWIGANVTICSGVTIGQGAVIAAGAVVTKNIPPYAIAGGIPAKVIKYRFSDIIISKLLSFNIVELIDNARLDNLSLFYEKIDEDNLDYIMSEINKY